MDKENRQVFRPACLKMRGTAKNRGNNPAMGPLKAVRATLYENDQQEVRALLVNITTSDIYFVLYMTFLSS
jgi:hypothetical protein